jgi:hypothetical protein
MKKNGFDFIESQEDLVVKTGELDFNKNKIENLGFKLTDAINGFCEIGGRELDDVLDDSENCNNFDAINEHIASLDKIKGLEMVINRIDSRIKNLTIQRNVISERLSRYEYLSFSQRKFLVLDENGTVIDRFTNLEDAEEYIGWRESDDDLFYLSNCTIFEDIDI